MRFPWSRRVGAGPDGNVQRAARADRVREVLRRVAPRTPVVPLGLVTVTLIALAVVPLTAEWYTRPIFEELRAVTAPAQQLLTRVHVALALEGATLRAFAETNNPALADHYRTVVAGKTEAQRQLGALAATLGPVVRARFEALERAEVDWHAAANEVFAGAVDEARADSRREQLYERALIAAARLDEALDQAVESRRARIRDAGRLQRGASIVLSVLALLALGAVGWLARRLRAAAAEAEAGRRAVEQLLESKARLMRGVSHDLKNPVNAIEGYAALLAEGVGGDLSPMQHEHVQRIRRGARSVLALVDDVLELSRADVGRIHIVCRPSDLRTVVVDAVDQHRPQAGAASHQLEARVPGDVVRVNTDSARVRQILGNLLTNAIKYTPPGGRIGVELEPTRDDRHGGRPAFIAIHVTDTGPGIPTAHLETIFDEFTRLASSDQPGAGLGLAIARRIARLLGGDITAQSEVGEGARFTLWLPTDCEPAGRQ